ncbi:MAG TPA: hypothetical protein VLR94_00670 [Acidobacteriota bacterium]|nr:hypothetical protein [Acidobacteriota bacterium]
MVLDLSARLAAAFGRRMARSRAVDRQSAAVIPFRHRYMAARSTVVRCARRMDGSHSVCLLAICSAHALRIHGASGRTLRRHLGAVCIVQTTDGNRYGFAAGLLAGFCFLVRPATAVSLLWPLPLWICMQSRSARLLFRFLAGALPGFLLFLLYNWQVFGHPLQSGYPLDPTYHIDRITAASFAGNVIWYFRNLNRWMWEWPWPDLLIFAPLILQRSKWREATLLAACSLSLMIGYCLFYYHDIVYAGPRYAFESMAFLVILAARAWVVLIEKFSARAGAAPVAALLLAALSLNRLPEQMEFHSQMYHSRSHELVEAVRQSAIGKRALIMIGGNPYVYGSFFLQNALVPDAGDRVFVREIAGQEKNIVIAYPREEVWKVTIEMQPIPGPNTYSDRWKLTRFAITRLDSRR